MKPAVGVRFKRAGKIYYFEAADCPDIGIGHQVVVDTSQGRELGRVVIAPDQLVEARPAGRLKPIVRVASTEDLEEQRQLRGRESEVLGEVMSEIVRLKLPMRAVMALGSDDGCVVWVNGTEVHRRKVERAYGAGQDRFGFDLRQGRNEILVRVGQVKGGWCFSARLQDSHGRPLPVRVVQMDPDPVM